MRLNIPAPSCPRVFFSLSYSTSAANIGPNAGICGHSIAAESGLAADIMRARVILREETDSKGRTTVRSARVERLPRQDVSCWKKSIPFQYFFFLSFLVCVCLVWLHKQMATDILISTGNTLGLSSAGIWHQQTTESEQIGFVSPRGERWRSASHGPKPCKWSLLFTCAGLETQ